MSNANANKYKEAYLRDVGKRLGVFFGGFAVSVVRWMH